MCSKSVDGKVSLEIPTQKNLTFLFQLAINTCHNCFSLHVQNEQRKNYEGPSPDEVAILQGIRDYCSLYLKSIQSKYLEMFDKESN